MALTQNRVAAKFSRHIQRMDSTVIDRHAAQVPRYTSYPTSPHFHAGVGPDTYRQWLGQLDPGITGSLYFHVPFCHRLCWFCGCHTSVMSGPRQVADYMELLTGEIDIAANAIDFPLQVEHIHLGGGTPTTISAEDFLDFMAHLQRRFDVTDDAEIAIEIDPRTLEPDMVRALGAAGVNRASLGVQDFNIEVQRAINRVQTLEQTVLATTRLRDAGINKISLDLMYGLPYQTTDDVIHSIDLALSLRPDRISLFGYAHVPWMKRHQKMIPTEALPNSEERLSQAQAAAKCLVRHGFRQIGLDHFALPDDPLCQLQDAGGLRRNFQGYTSDRAEVLLGFGASAISTLPQGYVQNTVDLLEYRARVGVGQPAISRGFALSKSDFLRRDIIQSLMCDLRVDLAAMKLRHLVQDESFSAEIEMLQPLVADGLLTCEDDNIVISKAGRSFLRTICAVFDQYLSTGRARHSQAV